MNILYLFLFSLTYFKTFTARLMLKEKRIFFITHTHKPHLTHRQATTVPALSPSNRLSLSLSFSFSLPLCLPLSLSWVQVDFVDRDVPQIQTGLNAHKTHHLLPFLHIWIYANSIAITDDSVSNQLLEDSDQSWLNICAFFVGRDEKHSESKDEAGQTDEKAVDEDNASRST